MDSPRGTVCLFWFIFTQKCLHDIHKLKLNGNTKFSNLFWEELADAGALKCQFGQRYNITVKSADKGGVAVVWGSRVYQIEALRQLSDTPYFAKVEEDLTPTNRKLVKDTIQNLKDKQVLPASPTYLIITTPKTSCIYFTPQIHSPNNPGRPIVFACGCPTELISSYLN